MEEIKRLEEERVKEEIARIISQYEGLSLTSIERACADQILHIKGILIKSDDQSLPDSPFAKASDAGDIHAHSRISGYYCCQQDMLTTDSEGRV